MSRKKRVDFVRDMLSRIIGYTVLAGVALGLPLVGLWRLAGTFDYETLRWIAIGLTFAVPLAAVGGFYAAKLEVRGFLSGTERAFEGIAKIVDLRDRSRVRVHRATQKPPKQEPNFNVFLPQQAQLSGQIPISHRQLSDGDEIIEL